MLLDSVSLCIGASFHFWLHYWETTFVLVLSLQCFSFIHSFPFIHHKGNPRNKQDFYFLPLLFLIRNIARGTTDPEIDSVTWNKFGSNMAPLALVANFATRWRHLHSLQIWPPDGAICISCKFGHQMAPLAVLAILTTRWHHLHRLELFRKFIRFSNGKCPSCQKYPFPKSKSLL